MSNSEYYDAMDNNKDDRTSSDEESFSSEGEGEADSINSENSELSKLGKLYLWVVFFYYLINTLTLFAITFHIRTVVFLNYIKS